MDEHLLELTVTQQHIDAGNPGDCYQCPVALALKEATGLCWKVHEDHLYCHERDYHVQPPQKVVDFIRAYDDGQAYLGEGLKPIAFSITLPQGTEEV